MEMLFLLFSSNIFALFLSFPYQKTGGVWFVTHDGLRMMNVFGCKTMEMNAKVFLRNHVVG